MYYFPLPNKSKGKKVKCALVQALGLCTGRTAHRGSRGIALLFLDHGTRRGWGVSVTPRPLFTPGKDPVPIVQEAGWAPVPVGTGAENLALPGIRSPDGPARSKSLYRLRYPAHIPNKSSVYFSKTEEKFKDAILNIWTYFRRSHDRHISPDNTKKLKKKKGSVA